MSPSLQVVYLFPRVDNVTAASVRLPEREAGEADRARDILQKIFMYTDPCDGSVTSSIFFFVSFIVIFLYVTVL